MEMTPSPRDRAQARKIREVLASSPAARAYVPLWFLDQLEIDIATALAAREAETREACAKIADAVEGTDNFLHSCSDNHLTEFEHGELHGKGIRYEISAAIRASAAP